MPVRCINSAGGYKSFIPTAVETNKKYADYGGVTIEGVGHYPMLEKPDEFNRKLRDVLKEFATKSEPASLGKGARGHERRHLVGVRVALAGFAADPALQPPPHWRCRAGACAGSGPQAIPSWLTTSLLLLYDGGRNGFENRARPRCACFRTEPC